MLWLTWRQHRTQLLVTLGFLAVVGGILLLSGQAALGAASGKISSYCYGGGVPCREYDAGLEDLYQKIYPLIVILPFVPLLAGVFWGAPLLAREYERGTYQLVWTQSVSRGRWLGAKFGVLAAAATLAGLASGRCSAGGWRSSPARRRRSARRRTSARSASRRPRGGCSRSPSVPPRGAGAQDLARHRDHGRGVRRRLDRPDALAPALRRAGPDGRP
ncbi:ABC transporter permease [Amycolatopsis sp. EV170708-02-1]|uniref:ABC transporter permease n=1 Tax=Amycolatopsis sp. EV170708-02-1 TaxID=2919322 RepID=UPI001F0C1CA0|nr:ABC transporter permease [Amycolatopsis sp. EV170708-02-1]UMP00551.1 ABC transporter permease [Amycolatopsis sp. EV170708-02-1]